MQTREQALENTRNKYLLIRLVNLDMLVVIPALSRIILYRTGIKFIELFESKSYVDLWNKATEYKRLVAQPIDNLLSIAMAGTD